MSKNCLGPHLAFLFLSLTVDPRRSCAPRLNGIGGTLLVTLRRHIDANSAVILHLCLLFSLVQPLFSSFTHDC